MKKPWLLLLLLSFVSAGPATTQTARTVLQIQSELRKARADVDRLTAELARLEGKAAPAAKEKETNDAIIQAMQDHELAIGMTLEQAQKSLELVPTLVYESSTSKAYRWAYLGFSRYAEFSNGKIIKIWRE